MDPARMLNLVTNGKRVTATETTIDGIRYIVFSNEGANAENLKGKSCTYEYETKWPYDYWERNSKDNNLPVKLRVTSVTKHPASISLSANSVTTLWNNPLTAPTVSRSQDNDGKLTFASSNESVVRVSPETGDLTAVAPGTATITVTGAETDYRQAPPSVSYTVNINMRKGDANWDGKVDNTDITDIIDHLAGKPGCITKQQADVNRDGRVDVADIVTTAEVLK